MSVGSEWLVDAEGCSAERLRDVDAIRVLCEEVVAELGLRVVGVPQWHKFPPPGGVTGLYLLAESHLACHTYPERGAASINLYCCRPRPAFAWDERLRESLGATRVTVRLVDRGCAMAEVMLCDRAAENRDGNQEDDEDPACDRDLVAP